MTRAISRDRRLAGAVVLSAMAAVPSMAAPPAARISRADLESIQAAVESAVSRVSRPAGLMFGRPGRAYHLKGYGAVVVLAPRALPRAARHAGRGPQAAAFAEVLRDLERSVAEVRDPAERRRLEETLAALREGFPTGRSRPRPPRPRLAMPPREVESIQQEAEAFRREAERAMEKAERDVLVGLRVPESAVPAIASVPPLPDTVEIPPPPPAPVVAPAPAVPPVPSAPPPPGAWSFRRDFEEGADDRAPDAVIADVGRAIVSALGAYRGDLAALAADEFVVVAVDFVPGMADRSAARTVVTRARKKDLLDHRAGRLTADALRARVEFDQY